MKKEITERAVKDRIKAILAVYAAYNKVYTLTPMTFGYGESGHPDRLILINGKMLGIEAKKDKNNHHARPELKPKPNEAAQKIQAAKINAAGGEWRCIHSDNLSELVELLDTYAVVKQSEFLDTDRARLSKLQVI